MDEIILCYVRIVCHLIIFVFHLKSFVASASGHPRPSIFKGTQDDEAVVYVSRNW